MADNICGSIEYSLKMANGNTIPTFLSLDSNQIKVKSDEISQIGTYSLQILAKQYNVTKILEFKVNILDPCIFAELTLMSLPPSLV